VGQLPLHHPGKRESFWPSRGCCVR
jgi:hypothetical protein